MRAAPARGTLAAMTVRPIEPGDAAALRRFHDRLSRTTVYRRYHAPHPELSDAELRFLTRADGRHHVAWVACGEDGEIAGVCRAIANDCSPQGEVAVVVADDEQHHGVGHALLERVLADAAGAGMRAVDAVILADNRPAQALLHSAAEELGVRVQSARLGPTVTLRLHIAELA